MLLINYKIKDTATKKKDQYKDIYPQLLFNITVKAPTKTI